MLAFSLLAIGLTLFRRPAKATLGGWEPRVTAVLGSYLLLAIPLFPSAHLGDAWSLAAIAVMTVGLLACVYCLAWLGRSYSIMATARKLVTEGPYRVVRHPLYAAEILLMIGVVMANLSPAAVIVATVVVALLYRRMINEERILATAFPEYAAYARQVPRIVPRFPLREVVLPAAPGR
jgi:protein-S-isoprenylcysteine O-methyltransferase Ste14